MLLTSLKASSPCAKEEGGPESPEILLLIRIVQGIFCSFILIFMRVHDNLDQFVFIGIMCLNIFSAKLFSDQNKIFKLF